MFADQLDDYESEQAQADDAVLDEQIRQYASIYCVIYEARLEMGNPGFRPLTLMKECEA